MDRTVLAQIRIQTFVRSKGLNLMNRLMVRLTGVTYALFMNRSGMDREETGNVFQILKCNLFYCFPTHYVGLFEFYHRGDRRDLPFRFQTEPKTLTGVCDKRCSGWGESFKHQLFIAFIVLQTLKYNT